MDKNQTMATSKKNFKSKRPPTVTNATTSRHPSQAKNNTIIGSGDVAICKSEDSLPNFDAEYREIAYGKFLRAMLEDCLVDEKISREETLMDVQLSQLADRFQKTMDQLDKTNKRLKDIRFVVEQKRLLDLKNKDCTSFYNLTEESQVDSLLKNLSSAEKAKLDRLETKNIDFGYNKESGHKQLLDAVTEAIEGLEQIKKHSDLDLEKLKEYEKTQESLEQLEKDRIVLENLKTEFEKKLPMFSEKLLIEASETLSNMINNEEDNTVPT